MIPLNFTLPIAGPVTADLDFDPLECQVQNDSIQLVVYVVDELGLPVSVRNASARKINILAPDGSTIAKEASFLTSGLDGALQYTTTVQDLRERGTYHLQAEFVIAGKKQTTRWGKFRVSANIDA